MSIPQIRTEAIEAVGRKILMEYDPSLLSGQPCSVPIETIFYKGIMPSETGFRFSSGL